MTTQAKLNTALFSNAFAHTAKRLRFDIEVRCNVLQRHPLKNIRVFF